MLDCFQKANQFMREKPLAENTDSFKEETEIPLKLAIKKTSCPPKET